MNGSASLSVARSKRVTISGAEQTRHCQWRLYRNASLSVASLPKRVTGSGAFVSYKYQPRRYLSMRVFIVIKNPFLGKRVTSCDAFQ
jgi:hypothetical protein